MKTKELRVLRVGVLVRHFKGHVYKVLAEVQHTETGEDLVVYQNIDDKNVYARPLKMFLEKVPEGKENPTGQKWRFEEVVE